MKLIILSIILVCLTAVSVFSEIPTITKIVPANMTLEDVCKYFLEVWNPSVTGAVKWYNAGKIYFNEGDSVILPEIITATKVYLGDISGKTCAELAEQSQMSLRLWKTVNPDVVCQ